MFIKRIGNHKLPLPKRATDGSAGLDLQSASDYTIIVPACGHKTIPTGFAMKIPSKCVGLVWPRSGLAVKYGIDTLAGVIDSDFIGEICVILHNHSDKPFEVNFGDRIAQLLVMPIYTKLVEEVESLDATERGEGGFGSTGR